MVKLLSHYKKVKVINGISEADKILAEEIKTAVSQEYFKQLRKILKSKVNGEN